MNSLIDTWARAVTAAGIEVETLVVIGAGDGSDVPSLGWRALPARHCVLVEGDELRCTRLARSVAGAAALRVRHQVAAATAGDGTWHRFEPTFLSGLHPQQDMKRLFPRLKLDRTEQVRATGMAELLSSSLPPADEAPARHALLVDISRGGADLIGAVPPELLARFGTVAFALCREDGPVPAELLQAWREGPAALVRENVDESDGSPLWSAVVLRRDEGQARENQSRLQTRTWEAELQSRDQEIERLRLALDDQVAMAPMRHELAVQGRRIEELQFAVAAALTDGERMAEARAAEQASAREREVELRQRADKLKSELTKAQGERDAALATAKDAGTRADARDADVARLEEALKVATERSQRLSGKIVERDARLQRLQEQLAGLEAERTSLDSEHQAELQAREHRIDALEQLRTQSETQRAEDTQRLAEARQRVDELQVQLDRISAEGEARLSQQQEQFAQNEAVLQQKLRTARRELETLRPDHERQVANLRAELEAARTEQQTRHDALQGQIAELEGLRIRQAEKIAAAEGELARLAAEAETSRQALAASQDELDEAQGDAARWKASTDDLRASEAALRSDLDEWSRQGLTLRVALDAANSRVLDLQGELALRQTENTQLDLRLRRLQEELHRAEGQLELVKELLLSDSGI